MGRTCGEPNETGLTPHGVELNGSGRVRNKGLAVLARVEGLVKKKGGSISRVGIFLDFASSSARTPHEAYVQVSGRSRVDPHGGGIERLGARTLHSTPTMLPPAYEDLITDNSGNNFRVGFFLDFVRRPGKAPHVLRAHTGV